MEVTGMITYVIFLIEQNVLNIHYVSGTIPGFRFTTVNEIID